MAINQKQAAKEFVERWKAEEGNEDRQSRSFWIELVQNVLGIDDPTHVLEFERKVHGRKIDVFYEDMGILIEQKSRGVDLDKKSERSKQAGEETPYQQAKWYADHLPNTVRPDWLIVSNFDEFRIHSLNNEDPEHDYVSFTLDELPEQFHLLDFFTDKSSSRLVKEKELSVKAGEIVGRLYRSLAAQYKNIDTDKNEQRSLNILIVRFVFLLYAEDAGILQEHQAFLSYMKKVEPEDMRTALIQLFKVLDTPEDQRDPYLPEKLAAFPYINGSLFAEESIIIPQFTMQIKYDLLKEASQEFDWSGISPTIFGAVFESTLNPETRHEGGMHYTSIENIHKVIDPLFLNDLKAELAKIEGLKVEKTRNIQLKQFQNKLASMRIFDPACGSGNFLTESYLSLRKLENRVLEDLLGDQMGMGFTGSEEDPIKVKIDQFYGIEINDFAVSVAKTALWIAEEQMMDITQDILFISLAFLPLSSNGHIVQGNALQMNWNDVIPASQCSYIVGNPPFLGASNCNAEQKEEIVNLFGKIKLSNSLDYVSGWYYKASEYIQNTSIKCAFVSTNSITQGEQVAPIWQTLYDRFGIHIDFAYRTFRWSSEAIDGAHVFVVIIGFSSCLQEKKPQLYQFETVDSNAIEFEVDHINFYLVNAPDAFVSSRSNPLSNVSKMVYGNKPTDDGNLILNAEERAEIIRTNPEVYSFIKPYVGAREFLNGGDRYCLWLTKETELIWSKSPEIIRRVNAVRDFRLASTAKPTRDKAETPFSFFFISHTENPFLVFPRHSGERRRYIPIGFMQPDIIASDANSVVPNATIYDFGILTSQFHNAWMRTVAGRLKGDYRYSGGVVYNTYVWPTPSSEQKQKIESLAQQILYIRDSYTDKSLSDLYDPDKMPSDLCDAHKALDKAVEEAYGVDFDGDEEKIVSHLFKLYADATKESK